MLRLVTNLIQEVHRVPISLYITNISNPTDSVGACRTMDDIVELILAQGRAALSAIIDLHSASVNVKCLQL